MTRLPADSILDLLSSLVDKSLVVYEEQDGIGRYRLLETVRQYGRERLTQSGEAETVNRRAADWFLALAEEAEPQLTGPEQASWLKRLETEHDNLRARLSWFEESSAGLEEGLRLAGALGGFWQVRGHLSEGRQWLGQALARAWGSEGDEGAMAAARAKAFSVAGLLSNAQSDYAGARALHEESLTLFQQLGDRQGVANSLNSLGNVVGDQGDFAGARALYEESLAIQRQLGNQRGVANSLNNLGVMASKQGDHAGARTQYEESLAIQRQLGNLEGVAISLGNLGNVVGDQGEFAAARALCEESLTLFQQLGYRQGVAILLNDLGDIARAQGDYAGARALYKESLEFQRQLGNQRGVAYSLDGFAGVAHEQGQPSRAARLWGAAAARREARGVPLSPPEQAELAEPLAAVRAALGEEAFESAWAEGRAMTLDAKVEFALEATRP